VVIVGCTSIRKHRCAGSRSGGYDASRDAWEQLL
jgi:hypothetical protein